MARLCAETDRLPKLLSVREQQRVLLSTLAACEAPQTVLRMKLTSF
jgi:hypothetical protein